MSPTIDDEKNLPCGIPPLVHQGAGVAAETLLAACELLQDCPVRAVVATIRYVGRRCAAEAQSAHRAIAKTELDACGVVAAEAIPARAILAGNRRRANGWRVIAGSGNIVAPQSEGSAHRAAAKPGPGKVASADSLTAQPLAEHERIARPIQDRELPEA